MPAVKDEPRPAIDGLKIVERYEAVVAYVYQAIENCPRRHRAARDVLVAHLLAPVGGLYHAAKSRQVSRLHAVDAEFATLRSLLRFAASQRVRMITPSQQKHALALLAEAGRMLGAWIGKLGNKSSAAATAVASGYAG